MSYLGRGLDKISNIEVLDNITFDGSSSYSITKGSVAFTPNSAQSLLISIDGVVQATNFTVSSSTIDFGVAIPSTSTCNFFLHYGTGVMTIPSDGSVTTAKLGDNAVTTAKINDDAVTKDKLISHNYPAFEAYLSSNQDISNATNTKVNFNTEVYDTDNMYDNSTNYRFTPTVSGKYYVYANVRMANSSASQIYQAYTYIYKNGSNYKSSEHDPKDLYSTTQNLFVSAVVDMNGSSDYLEIFGYIQRGSGTPRFEAGTKSSSFGAYRIGD